MTSAFKQGIELPHTILLELAVLSQERLAFLRKLMLKATLACAAIPSDELGTKACSLQAFRPRFEFLKILLSAFSTRGVHRKCMHATRFENRFQIADIFDLSLDRLDGGW